MTGVDSVGEGLPVARAHAAAMGLNVEYMQKTVSTDVILFTTDIDVRKR